MKDVESVTGHMGEGEAMTPAEEAVGVTSVSEATTMAEGNADTNVGDGAARIPEHGGRDASDPSPHNGSDLWQVLVQVGAQVVAALGAAGNPGAPKRPWIERDPSTGVQRLKVPLPPPQTAGHIADVLSMLASTLRG